MPSRTSECLARSLWSILFAHTPPSQLEKAANINALPPTDAMTAAAISKISSIVIVIYNAYYRKFRICNF
jgi:hypothetical protein